LSCEPVSIEPGDQWVGQRLAHLNEIVLGKRGITADTALRLSAEHVAAALERLQADWFLHQALHREGRRAS
jgi:plasmid maintenance system antidote protein VapI